jgi:hypothetical protein
MAKRLYANNASSWLSAAISSSGATSITVLGGTWPASGDFTIRIGNSEIALVTAISGSGPYTFTVTRGQEGTTATTFPIGTIVYATLSDEALRSLVRQTIDGTNAASRREINYIQNGVFVTATDDAGNDRVDLSLSAGGYGNKFTKPVSGDFSWINQGGASIAASGSGLYLTAPNNGAADNLRIRKITTPAAPYTIKAFLRPLIFAKNYHVAGLIFRQSSDGKLVSFGVAYDGSGKPQLQITKWTDATTVSADYTTIPLHEIAEWLQIADDNTTESVQYRLMAITGFQFIQSVEQIS